MVGWKSTNEGRRDSGGERMSLITEIGRGPFTTVVMPTVGIGPRGLPGPGSVILGNVESGLLPIRFVGVAEHAGPPNAGDGAFLANDVAFDNIGQQFLCVADGTPGTWIAIGGSGKVLGSVRSSSQYNAASSGATDVPGVFTTFTYDGRPVWFGTTPTNTALNSPAAASKLINLIIARTTDGAVIGNAYREQETAMTGQIQPHHVLAGPFTAWPSDGVPFVVGTTYGFKL